MVTFEDLLNNFPPMPLDPTKKDIKQRKAYLNDLYKKLDILEKRLDAERDYLYSLCDHSDSYSENTWGRDPGGGGCNTCGKCW